MDEKENALQPGETEDFRRSFDQKSPSELKTTNGSNLRSLAYPGKSKADSPLRSMVIAAMNSATHTNAASRDNLRHAVDVANTPTMLPSESFSKDEQTLGSKSRRKGMHVRMPTERERSLENRVEMSPEFHDARSHTISITQAQSATLGQRPDKHNISAGDYRSRRSGVSASLSNVGKTVHQVDLRSEDNRSLQRQIEDKLVKIQRIFSGGQQVQSAEMNIS